MIALLVILSVPIILLLSLDSILRGFYLAVRLFPAANPFPQNAVRSTQYTIPHTQHPTPNLGILILAHNEEPIIGDTVRHLQQLPYPRDRFQVIVVADNCQDATAAEAHAAGARVWIRHDPHAFGKGAALRWFTALARGLLKHFDALVILDADSRITSNFLTQVSHALSQGVACAQSFLMPVPTKESLTSLLAAYSELLSQHIDATARNRLGWPAQLYGTGMVFQTELLPVLTHRLQTKVEDVELTLAASALATPVFVPHAIVYDPKPTDAARVAKQRARWLQGQVAIWRDLRREWMELLIHGNLGTKALVFSLLLKPKSLVFLAKALLLGMWSVIAVTHQGIALVGASVLAGAMLIDVMYYLVGLLWIEEQALYAKALLALPLYPILWFWGIVTATRSREAWLRVRE